jgi:hypothetical protein
MPTAFGLPALASLNDPSIAVDQAALERQMAIAQALRQQAMTPVDTSGRQVGGIGYKVSPLEGIAKALQAYQANKMDAGNDTSRMALAQRMAQALKGTFGDQAAPQSGTDTSSGYPQSAPSQGGSSGMGLGGMIQMGIANDIGGPEAAKIVGQKWSTPEAIQVLRGKGQDPHAVGALETGELQRKVSDATAAGRGAVNIPGMPGPVGVPPAIPGTSQSWNPATKQWDTQQVAGALPAVQAAATAETLGKNPGVDENGKPLPFGGRIAPASTQEMAPQQIAILKKELQDWQAAPPSPARTQNMKDIQTQLDSVQPKAYAAPPLGTENTQKMLDQAWTTQMGKNREAQNTKSYLQNIVTAAEKGAIVGPGADRREMIQGMLQLAGVKEQVNTNATTQTQLLDKYANQIVTRLGQGGLGTDAARAMLESAYPGKHMNVEAIREAAGNLMGAQEMEQAKTRFLTDPATKRDAAEYQKREVTFDQAADPRVWQYKSIRDPQQRKAFAQTLMQQDPTFPDRIKKLESLGAL